MLIPDIKNILPNNEDFLNIDFEVQKFDMTINDINEEDDITHKVIKYTEGLVRRCYEYKKYISYLKNELDLTKCSFLNNIDTKDVSVSLEFHHYPFTLYDIVEAVAKKLVDDIPEGKYSPVSCFDIADLVMEEHFRNNIGLVPLTKTMHELAHSRSIHIPLDKAYGEHSNFKHKYDKYLSDEAKFNYNKSRKINESLDFVTMNDDKIKKRIIKYSINYS